MKKICSRLPVLLVLAAIVLGAWIETASAGKSPSLVSTTSSGSTVSNASRSGASFYNGDPDVGQDGVPAQKRLLPLVGGIRTPLSSPRDLWTIWIWAWNLRVAR